MSAAKPRCGSCPGQGDGDETRPDGAEPIDVPAVLENHTLAEREKHLDPPVPSSQAEERLAGIRLRRRAEEGGQEERQLALGAAEPANSLQRSKVSGRCDPEISRINYSRSTADVALDSMKK